MPLIVVTADRPPELQGVGAPQTIDQRNLYGSSVRRYIDAGVADDERRDDWRRMARRAYESSTGESPGPVQVNLAFREPLVGSAGQLPAPFGEPTSRRTRLGSRPLSTAQMAALAARLRKRRGSSSLAQAERARRVSTRWPRGSAGRCWLIRSVARATNVSPLCVMPTRYCAMRIWHVR